MLNVKQVFPAWQVYTSKHEKRGSLKFSPHPSQAKCIIELLLQGRCSELVLRCSSFWSQHRCQIFVTKQASNPPSHAITEAVQALSLC